MNGLAAMVCLQLIVLASCSNNGDVEGTTKKKLNGKSLLDIGRMYNKPLLRLIGSAMINVACQNNPCNAWSSWSSCKLFVGQYGVRSRSRQCGGETGSGCPSQGIPRVDHDTAICQEFCPSNYEMVQDRFCLKFYAVRKTYASAMAACEADGGHLISINSDSKWQAFSYLVEMAKYPSCVRVNGHRKDSNSPWTFSYEAYMSGYTHWAPNEPDNGSKELSMCAAKSSSSEGLYDVPYTSTYYYMCEIVPA